MEDVAIGGGAGAQMGKTAAETADNSGPLEQRLVSKNWSVRANAFDELNKLCLDGTGKEPVYQEHVDSWKLFLKDSNPGALEKALTAMISCLKKMMPKMLIDHQNGIIQIIIEKMLLTHAKPNIKAKSLEVFLMLFEVTEVFDESIDTLKTLLAHKNVKVLANAVLALANLVESYGVKKVKISEYAEVMLKNAQNTNPDCKKFSYQYYKAVYKWIGDVILPQIEDKLKKAQMDDLKKLFEEQKASGDKTKRLTRKEAKQKEEDDKNAAIQAAIDAENGEAPAEGGDGNATGETASKEEPAIDPLEFAPEKDILAEFGQEWMDKVAPIKKWNEKVEEFEKLIKACEGVKIIPGNYEQMCIFLSKEIKAVNMNTAIAAINIVTKLASGMKTGFAPYIKIVIEAVLLRYKEKRPVAIEATTKCCDAIIDCCQMDEISEQFIPCITNVAPGVRTNTILFVEKYAKVTYIDVLQKVADALLPVMQKVVDDKDGGVRDVAIHCMGTLKGRLGDSVMSKYTKDLNPQKTTKLEEAAAEIKPSKFDRPKDWKPPVAKKKKAPPKQEEEKLDDQGDVLMNDDIGFKPPIKKKKAVKKKPEPSEFPMENEVKPAETVAPKAPANLGEACTTGPTPPVQDDNNLGSPVDADAALEIVTSNFGEEAVKNFDSAKWQDKVAGFEALQNKIRQNEFESDVLEAVCVFMKSKMKDFKESNINLQKGLVATYTCMANDTQALSKRALSVTMPFFTDKIGDVKLQKLIMEMLMIAAEVATPKFVALKICEFASKAKAPNTIKEACNLIIQLINEFGPKIPLKETLDFAKIAAAQTTPAVRQAACKLFKEVFKHFGDVIRPMISDIKESTLKIIDGELKTATKYERGEHQPCRKLRGAAAEAAPLVDKGPVIDLPKQDISKKLTSKLLDQYGHKDWKVRKKCGDDIEAILKDAKMRIEPNGLNDMMEVMKKAMKDSNKAVIKVFIILLGLLADALGGPISKYQKKCFVPMLANLSDKQQLVRDEVVKCMNKWSEAIGADKIINHLGEIIIVDNPECRTEGLKWILIHENSIEKCDHATLIKPLISCMTDRSKDIRSLAEQVSLPVMRFSGQPKFVDAIKDRPPAVQQTLRPILEKLKTKCASDGDEKPKAEASPEKKPEPPQQQNSFKRDKTTVSDEQKEQKEQEELKFKPKPGIKPKSGDADPDDFTITPQNKKKREQWDTRTKYQLNEVKGDHVERLQDECQKIFGLKFHDQMFAKNTEFQKHIKCVEKMETLIENQPAELMEILDIIFKWGNLRMSDSSNTKLVTAFFDFYEKLLNFLIQQEYQMFEFEMIILLGTLCDKTGHNIKVMAEKARMLALLCYQVYEPKLCFKLIMTHGVGAKNLKAVSESLDILAEHIKKYGVDSITKKDFAVFLDKANSGDKNVRENTLRVMAETYKVLGEDVWRLLGKEINVKVKGLLEQRFKQVAQPSQPGNMSNRSRGNPMTTSYGNKSNPMNRSRGPMSNRGKDPMNVSQGGFQFNKDKVRPDGTPTKSPRKFQPSKSPVRPQTADVNMQDVFQGKAELPVSLTNNNPNQPQEANDVVMDAEPDKVAEVVGQSNNEPDRNLDDILAQAEDLIDIDPELRKQMDIIQKHIDQLKVGDLLKRVDSLVALNEVISATGQSGENEKEGSASQVQQTALIRLCDKLINAFSQVMIDIFSFPVKEIPLRFTKYFITIVNKTCSSKEIMKEVSCAEVRSLVDQLLQRLLIDNLDKIGSNKEGELILKNLNSSMLRMLENCNHTHIFVVLFGLLTKYKDSADQPKIPSLIIKCLLKLSKNMDKLIEKVDLKRFMVAIHEYLITIPPDKKTQNDDLGTRIAKTLINEIVKLKRDEIWDYYQVIEQHQQPDNHLQKWIQIILKSLVNPVDDRQSSTAMINKMDDINTSKGDSNQGRIQYYTDFEMKKIVQDLKDGNRYTNAIQRLDKFIKTNPNFEWKKSLAKEGLQFTQKVSSDLDKLRKGLFNVSSHGMSGDISNNNTTSSMENRGGLNRMEEIKNKLTGQNEMNTSMSKTDTFKAKMNKIGQKRDSVLQPGQQNLNTSFSEMNRNLSNKWAAINRGVERPGGLTGRDQPTSGSNLSNTMRHTMNNGSSGSSSLLNTSSGGFKNRLQNKFANKQNNSSLGGGPAAADGAETGTIGQRISPTKGMQPSSTQSNLTRSNTGNQQKLGNSFRDRIKGIKSTQQIGGGLANTQGPASSGIGGGGAATNQDLQKRLADMKAKLHGLRKDQN